jgi:hypothetical protein
MLLECEGLPKEDVMVEGDTFYVEISLDVIHERPWILGEFHLSSDYLEIAEDRLVFKFDCHNFWDIFPITLSTKIPLIVRTEIHVLGYVNIPPQRESI